MAGQNELVVGTARLGWFADGDARTPNTAALLQDTGDRITLTVPLFRGGGHERYERWFLGTSTRFGDDPDRTLYAYEVPSSLEFADADGPVTLLGCQSAGLRTDLASGIGQGDVDVRIAILGALGPYDKIHGLRSQIPGLAEWMGIRSLEQRHTTDSEGLVQAVDFHVESPPPIPLGPRLNLSLRPAWTVLRPAQADTVSLQESMQVQTLVTNPRDWTEHLPLHNAVRDLLDVAAWRPFGFSKQWAHRADDPERVLSGAAVGARWAPIRTYAVRGHQPAATRANFLFAYPHIGAPGVRTWLKLREHFWRGVAPALSVLDLRGAFLETQLVQSGIGLDAIGYQLALDAGLSKTKARRESYGERLERVLTDCKVIPVDDAHEWVRRSTAGYNGVKHANRDMPDRHLKRTTIDDNVLVFRYWVASRLGVPAQVLESRRPPAHG